MVHRFLECHPEGLLIETGNYATYNPLPGHAVWLDVLVTLRYPDKKNKKNKRTKEQTLSSKLLIRSAALNSTIPPNSFSKFSYSCAFSDKFSTCL